MQFRQLRIKSVSLFGWDIVCSISFEQSFNFRVVVEIDPFVFSDV
jgi:hypothetical protein